MSICESVEGAHVTGIPPSDLRQAEVQEPRVIFQILSQLEGRSLLFDDLRLKFWVESSFTPWLELRFCFMDSSYPGGLERGYSTDRSPFLEDGFTLVLLHKNFQVIFCRSCPAASAVYLLLYCLVF